MNILELSLYIVILAISLFLVVKTAGWFLNSAEVIGKRFKMPPFFIGVILVGFGTSLPELTTSISAIISERNDVAIANVIGSNIANLLLIIGLSALLGGALFFRKKIVQLGLAYLFTTTILLIILVLDGNLSLYDGIALLLGFIFYLLYSVAHKDLEDEEIDPQQSDKKMPGLWQRLIGKQTVKSKQATSKKKSKDSRKVMSWQMASLVAVGSIAMLAVAARGAVTSMLEIATIINIGASVVTFLTLALGTSLSELAVSFKALKAGQGDLFLGNIIGSCCFNILLIGGVASVIDEQILSSQIYNWAILGLIMATLAFIISGLVRKISPWQGAFFILIYVVLMVRIIN